MVNSALKNALRYFCKYMECLNKDTYKKKIKLFLYIRGRAVLITTIVPNCLINKYKFYGFNDNLTEIIN